MKQMNAIGKHEIAGDGGLANRSFWFNGVIRSCDTFENWETIKLVQPDGYKVDLLLRFHEIVDSFGKTMTVRYWITDNPTTKEDAQEGFIRSMFGEARAEMEANSYYRYSEYTSGMDYDSMLKIGGHNLMNELAFHQGKHIWLEISTPIRP